MRHFIDMVESKTIVDTTALLDHLKVIARALSTHPYYLKWDYQWGKMLKQKVDAVAEKYDAQDDPVEFDYLYTEELNPVYKRLALMTFSKVASEVTGMVNEYQARHGARMDQDAGYTDPMHYVESSDWLSAMAFQKRVGETLYTTAGNLRGIETVIKNIADFVTEFAKMGGDDEPILADSMQAGLRGAVPLLILVLSKQ